MTLLDETRALRREMASLAATPDWNLLVRSDLLADKPPRLLRDRAWRRIRRALCALRLAPPHVTHYPWLPTLKHGCAAPDAGALLVWAVGVAPDDLRAACLGLGRLLRGNDSLAPVLVTDVADFAWFSRLGWLVEYLPELGGQGTLYTDRKKRHLAWRYRKAVVVPVSAGLASPAQWRELLNDG